ncbi:MAG: prepilin peptidase [Planctomycetes bacterium]|jgi:prepilin signal peptidase PulO-like enzyme (type II secretory pathway)|nr:prepilin peptidase [Planctomycetota bacterium]
MIIFIVLAFILGLIIGSFLNCLAWRLYQEETILGRSYCPKCRRQIVWYDNIPVISFILLRGRCRHCHKTISWQYPLVEIITATLFALAVWLNISGLEINFKMLIPSFLLIATMMVVFISDSRWLVISNWLILVMTPVFFLYNIFILHFSLANLAIGILVGTSVFALQYFITKGRGIGEGDIWLGLLLGTFFGWAQFLVVFFLTYVGGSIISLFLLLLRKKKLKSKLPLGIFLAPAAIITLFWGEKLIAWYLNLLS